ncbi:uncharacterized protein LOC126896482 isoform X3 [Daktulosphaira vitifoliae]|uniref:uncharacterized protein LOC126896482 isoform X3 n=1 Tax=Daktulosphaira vitifoliae TaxID=58002 RepID=UPI0021AAA859|nr:uncharacterized protein LOC126896482 isoform X3 [Daktulosphaira vitifoliae]
MKYINFVIAYIIMFGLFSSNFLDCHVQGIYQSTDTAYRELRRFFPMEWKRANNLGSRFYVGKKFVGYTMFDNGRKMQRKSSKIQRSFKNYEVTFEKFSYKTFFWININFRKSTY